MISRTKLLETLCWLIGIGLYLSTLPTCAQTSSDTIVTKTVIKQASAKPDLYILTFDTKRRELLKVISEGIANGQLTQSQAAGIQAELDSVAKLVLIYKKYGAAVPYAQIAVIATRLDTISQKLNNLYAFTFVPIMTNGLFTAFSGEIIQLDVIAMRRAELEGKISLALADNTLTRSQVKKLRAQLDDIATLEVQFRHGLFEREFTSEQTRALFQAFDRVGTKLDSFIASNKVQIN